MVDVAAQVELESLVEPKLAPADAGQLVIEDAVLAA